MGFGESVSVFHKVKGTITPLKKRVLVSDMHFGMTKTKGGIILQDDDGSADGVHPRWAKVYAIGKDQEDVKVGEWVLVAHGRWTRYIKLEDDTEVRMIDEHDILLVSDKEPDHNRLYAGYVNTGGAKQMSALPGND
jgi:co-chaperonin GroES (HSP10)